MEDAEELEEEGVGGRKKITPFQPSVQTACPGVTEEPSTRKRGFESFLCHWVPSST